MWIEHTITAENGWVLDPSWHNVGSLGEFKEALSAAWISAAQAFQIAEDPELQNYYYGITPPIESQPIEGVIQVLLPEQYSREGINDGMNGRLFLLGSVQTLLSGEMMFQVVGTDVLSDDIGKFCDDYPDTDFLEGDEAVAEIFEFYLKKADG